MTIHHQVHYPSIEASFERVRRDAARERQYAISTLMRSIFRRAR